jgi:hypothetical protein
MQLRIMILLELKVKDLINFISVWKRETIDRFSNSNYWTTKRPLRSKVMTRCPEIWVIGLVSNSKTLKIA